MKGILLFDGAFGTYIAKKINSGLQPELYNLTSPETVGEICREYIDAGANAVKTNTFAANPAAIPDKIKLRSVIEAGWKIANGVSGGRARVFADIGPVSSETAEADYMATTGLFIGLGARDFLFETQGEAAALKSALEQIRGSVRDAHIIVSFAVGQDGYSRKGLYYRDLLDEAVSIGADTVGLNCLCGPTHIYNLLGALPAGRYDLSAMPNSGYPSMSNNRVIYVDNPEYFAEKLAAIHALGVNTLGGCCGTTPAHIAGAAKLLRGSQARVIENAAAEESGRQSGKFDLKKGFIAVEIPAPVDTSADYMLEAARKAKEAGADFVTIPDSPLGRTHAGSIAMSALVKEREGIDAIAHLCCRDRNQIAIKGDLLAGSITGVDKILAITGDPVAETERAETKNVFGFNSFRLISFIKSLNETVFAARPYTVFAALNTSARNFDAELKRASEKLERGAECLFTQPLFSERNIENYKEARALLGCRIAVGIMPLAGYKNAVFLNNEVPGVEIPLEVLDALEGKKSKEAAPVCLQFAMDTIKKAGYDSDGFYIMPTLKNIDTAVKVVEYIVKML